MIFTLIRQYNINCPSVFGVKLCFQCKVLHLNMIFKKVATHSALYLRKGRISTGDLCQLLKTEQIESFILFEKFVPADKKKLRWQKLFVDDKTENLSFLVLFCDS